MLNRSKRLQRIALNAVLAAGLLTCSVMAANAQAQMSADEQVRAAQEASEKAAKAKPSPQPTTLVLMNGFLVEVPIATGQAEETQVQQPPSTTRKSAPKKVTPTESSERRATDVPADDRSHAPPTTVAGPRATDVPAGNATVRESRAVPGEPRATDVPAKP